jgi:predicted ester cyclase
MDRRAIERLVWRWANEGIVEGRLSVFDDLVVPEVVDRSGPAPWTGVESVKARASAVRAAFDELEIRVDELLVEGDGIAWRWTLHGKHVGTFAGVEPTGRRVALRGVNFQRLEGDRVAEHWTLVDVFGALQALRN